MCSGGLPWLMAWNRSFNRGQNRALVGQQAFPRLQVIRAIVTFDGQQAVGVAVELALAHRQQIARFGVEDEDEPVKQDERVVVDLLQRLRRGLQIIAGIIEKPLREWRRASYTWFFRLLPTPWAYSVLARSNSASPSGPGSKAARRKKA